LPTALLLITTEIGEEIKVMRLLKKIEGVEAVYLVYSAYDIVAKIRTESLDELQDIVTNRLIRLKEIRSCTKMVIIPEKPKVVVLTEEKPRILT
jgi:DNA-binding Lrp family transcriptional regulator